MSEKKSKFGLGILLGGIGGIIAGLFLSEKPGKKLRQYSVEEYEKFKKLLEEREGDQAIREIFGKITEESKTAFEQAKEYLAQALADLKANLGKINKNKYKKIVNDVTRKIKEEKKLPDDVLKKLAKYLEDDFNKIISPENKSKVIKKSIKKLP